MSWIEAHPESAALLGVALGALLTALFNLVRDHLSAQGRLQKAIRRVDALEDSAREGWRGLVASRWREWAYIQLLKDQGLGGVQARTLAIERVRSAGGPELTRSHEPSRAWDRAYDLGATDLPKPPPRLGVDSDSDSDAAEASAG